MFCLNNNLWSYAFFAFIWSTIVINNAQVSASAGEPISFEIKNLRPAAIDDTDRNFEKLMIILNGSCASSIDTVTEIVAQMQASYPCLSLWISEANPNSNGIYPQANGNYHVYFMIGNAYDETTCIDHILIDYGRNCIQVVDYELKLFHQGCKRDGVYDYPDTTDYRWHRDSIDGIIDQSYSHLDTSGADTVDVYVLDTGIYSPHYEFSQVKSFTALDPSYDYTSVVAGHGTHVAGIIVGRTVGLTNHALFDYPVCRGESAACFSSYIDDAFNVIITRAQQTKRRGVINMSFGSSLSSSSTPIAYTAAVDSQMATLVANGIIPVAAAGNSGKDACESWPAMSDNTIGVGAYDSSFSVPSWSNYGSCVDIYSPGVGILSSWIGSSYSYQYASGTSMATPMVAALVADMLWYDKSITYDQIVRNLKTANNVALSTCPAASSAACYGVRVNCSLWYKGTGSPTSTSSPTAKPTTTSSPTSRPTTTASPTARPTTTQSPTTTKSPTLQPSTTKPPTLQPSTKSPTLQPSTTKSPTLRPTTKSPTSKPSTKSPTTTCRASGISCISYSQCCSQSCVRRTCQ